MSASRAMCLITSAPRGSVRLSVIPCLLRLTQLNCGAHSHQKSSLAPPARQPSIRWTDSTLITSAPPSAKTSVVIGPDMNIERSMTRSPSSGRCGSPPLLSASPPAERGEKATLASLGDACSSDFTSSLCSPSSGVGVPIGRSSPNIQGMPGMRTRPAR